MLKFNNDHIFTGYLKQLLSSYNLTRYRSYQANKDNIIVSYPAGAPNTVFEVNDGWPTDVYYVKDGQVQKYCVSQLNQTPRWQAIKATGISNSFVDHYQYFSNLPDLNHTQTFPISNNIYDSATHKYLGDFLRCLRDFYSLDLMSLYNCFSNEIVDQLNLEITFDASDNESAKKAIFTTQDSRYKIYAIPVKLFQNYTIAIDCAGAVELCCSLYNPYVQDLPKKTKNTTNQIDKKMQSYRKLLQKLTYQKISNLCFSQPKVFSKLFHLKQIAEKSFTTDKEINKQQLNKFLAYFANQEKDLCMLLKLPADNHSTITILQGNYSGWNDRICDFNGNNLTIKHNTWHTNLSKSSTDNQDNKDKAIKAFTPITQLQLLKLNTGTSYPFADRLIEYLVGQAITNHEDISDNVQRIRATIAMRPNHHYSGVWSDQLRVAIYDYMNKWYASNKVNHDILGYVDKDVQALFAGYTKNHEQVQTLMDVDIYQNEYIISGRN